MTQLSSRTAQAKLAAEIEASRPVPEWDTVPELRKWKEKIKVNGKEKSMSFDEQVVKYKELGAEIEFRKKLQDDLKPMIQAALLMADVEKVNCEGYRVQIITKEGSKKIDAHKLMDLGVDADVIDAATVQGKGSSYVDIRPFKEEKY